MDYHIINQMQYAPLCWQDASPCSIMLNSVNHPPWTELICTLNWYDRKPSADTNPHNTFLLTSMHTLTSNPHPVIRTVTVNPPSKMLHINHSTHTYPEYRTTYVICWYQEVYSYSNWGKGEFSQQLLWYVSRTFIMQQDSFTTPQLQDSAIKSIPGLRWMPAAQQPQKPSIWEPFHHWPIRICYKQLGG